MSDTGDSPLGLCSECSEEVEIDLLNNDGLCIYCDNAKDCRGCYKEHDPWNCPKLI